MWEYDFKLMVRTHALLGEQKLIEISGLLYGIPYEGRTPIKFNEKIQEMYRSRDE